MATNSELGNSLRKVLFTDALTCAAGGLLMLLGAAPLGALLRIPVGLLFYAGLSLLPITGLMTFVGAQRPHSIPLVWVIIAGNVVWAIGSVWLMVSGAIAPNGAGLSFIGVQAAVVGVLAALEVRAALRM